MTGIWALIKLQSGKLFVAHIPTEAQGVWTLFGNFVFGVALQMVRSKFYQVDVNKIDARSGSLVMKRIKSLRC